MVGTAMTDSREGWVTECLAMLRMGWLLSLPDIKCTKFHVQYHFRARRCQKDAWYQKAL